jgi:2-polyprenyl-3-methyl-5-hydroxy-6-metoxy-1,4-benzoquinol methylase
MQKSEKFWDRLAKNYESETQGYHIEIAEKLGKYLSSSDRVLDDGCATGLYTLEIADHVNEVHGVDISSKMVEIAEKIAGEMEIENAHFAQGTIFDEKYTPESFNAIVTFNLLHLLEEPGEHIRRTQELLAPGGYYISDTVCMGEGFSLLNGFLSLLSKIGLIPQITRFTTSELKELITNANFEIIEIEQIQKNPPKYYIVAKKV